MKKRKQKFGRTQSKGQTKSPHYKRWSHMRHRCYVKNHSEYHRYGAKGIKVCDEWLLDFFTYEKYILSLKNAGKSGYTVDRINSNKNYEPGNLRWACKTVQSRNCKTSSNNTSGTTGVGWSKQSGKWRAHIMLDRKQIHLGFFDNIDDAIKARKQAEEKYNFPQSTK